MFIFICTVMNVIAAESERTSHGVGEEDWLLGFVALICSGRGRGRGRGRGGCQLCVTEIHLGEGASKCTPKQTEYTSENEISIVWFSF